MKGCFISIWGLALSASIATAAPATAAAPAIKQSIPEILAKGGPMMYPLGVMSVLTVILILLFLLTIRRNAIVSDRFMNSAETMIRKRDYLGLLAYSQRRNECMARIAQKTLEFSAANPSCPFASVRDAAQTEGSRQAGILTSRITYLADIGSIAPMVGLLGTVIGMIKAFLEISQGEVGVQGVRQMGLAQGVSEALIATAGGLAISIIALGFYSFFRGRVQKYIGELEAAATHLLAVLHGEVENHGVANTVAHAMRGHEEPPRSPVAATLAFRGERHDIQGI